MAQAAPAPQIFSDIHEGDRGSRVLTLSSDDEQALRRLVENLGGGFRKVWFDLVGGFVEFMSPSQAHEFTSRDARDLVLALCHACGIDVVDMGATSVEAPDGFRGGDPDESFLIGKRAGAYREIEVAQGADAAMASIDKQPPDLAVEVEHTYHQPEKIAIYRACGVQELWDLATEHAGRGPVIYDLQAEGEPRATDVFRLLPGVRAESLPAAAADLQRIGGPLRFAEQLARGEPVDRRLLAVAGALEAPRAGEPPRP